MAGSPGLLRMKMYRGTSQRSTALLTLPVLTMSAKLYLGQAFKLVFKTMPVLIARLTTGALVALGLIVYAIIAIAVAVGAAALWEPLGFLVGIPAVIGFGWLIWYTQVNHLYLLRAAHAAVLTYRIRHGRAPDGGQVAFGKRQVRDRFGSPNAMYRVDRKLSRTVRRFNRQFTRGLNRLPIPGAQVLHRIMSRLSSMMTQHIDQAILSRAYVQTEDDPWTVARDGMVLYAQAWKPVLANSLALSVLGIVEFIILLAILALPVLAVASVASLAVTIGFAVAAFIIAYMLKVAVSDAFSLAATLLAFHKATEGVEPDPVWRDRLDQAINPFGDLVRQAQTAVANHTSTHDGPLTS